ncbi:uroporphyrinogen III methyltransferase / synthase [Methanophagales archaeon]|nr:uroporphyrinogen III methyltransferase / synthase [Methanophagales archaeon]
MQNRKKIAVFRPENVLKKTKEIADRYGFDFFGFPLFELVEREGALAEIESVFVEGVDIAVFTSINGVKKTFGICNGKFNLKKKFQDDNVAVCAIGPATKAELANNGLHVHIMPVEYSSDGLKKVFGAIEVKDTRIVFLRSSEGGKDIITFLDGNGAFVTDIAIYNVNEIALAECEELFNELVWYGPDYVIFTSSMTFRIFLKHTKKLNIIEKVFENAKIVAIGDLTAETITEEGLNVDLIAQKSTISDLLKEIREDL